MEIAVNIDITGRQVGSNDHRIDSTNLRDLLRIEQDDESRTNLALADQTLSSSSNFEKRGGGSLDRIQSSRTLRDVIREDSKKSWKSLKDMLILRQDYGSNLDSSVPMPASDDVPIHRDNSFRNITQWGSTRITTPASDRSDHPNTESTTPRSRSPMLSEEPGGEAENNEAAVNGGGREEPLARMSLMALLAETDKPICINGSSYAVDEEEEVEEEKDGREYNNCCVCMLRHKGSAFIPCGHTFCRLCSRELWVQRGNCPLCNNVILEILDIF